MAKYDGISGFLPELPNIQEEEDGGINVFVDSIVCPPGQ